MMAGSWSGVAQADRLPRLCFHVWPGAFDRVEVRGAGRHLDEGHQPLAVLPGPVAGHACCGDPPGAPPA